MANEFLNRINKELKQKVRDKKQDEKDEVKTGLLSFMLEEAVDKIVNALGTLKLPTPQVDVKPPEVNVTVPDIVIPEIKAPEVKIPQIKVPEARVTVDIPEIKIPEIKIPEIKVPTPKVTVNVPKADTPIVNIPETVFPDEMKVKAESPLPVVLHDSAGKPYVASGGSTSGGVHISKSRLIDKDGCDLHTEDGVLTVSTVEHLTTFTEEYTADGSGNIAATEIIAGIAGTHYGVQAISITTDSTAGTVNLDFLTSGCKIFRAYFAKETSPPSISTHIEGADGEAITFEASSIGASKKVFISVSYIVHGNGAQ